MKFCGARRAWLSWQTSAQAFRLRAEEDLPWPAVVEEQDWIEEQDWVEEADWTLGSENSATTC
jgi:hypothetical protein